MINKKKIRPISVVTHIFLIMLSVIFIYPLIWLILSSLKTNTELFMSPWALPEVFQWHNYSFAWVQGNIGRYMINSMIVTFSTLAIVIVFSTMAAYGVQRMKWKLSSTVMMLFMLGLMVPIHVTIIPLFLNFSRIGLLNNHLSLIIPYTTFALPTSILILAGFFSTIPREFEDAAVIDGCSIPQAFVKIIVPISQPAIITVTIFNFIATWNELLVAVLFIGDANRFTLPVGLLNFVGMYSTNFAPMLAGTALAVMPVIIIYSLLNSRIVDGIAAGALKG